MLIHLRADDADMPMPLLLRYIIRLFSFIFTLLPLFRRATLFTLADDTLLLPPAPLMRGYTALLLSLMPICARHAALLPLRCCQLFDDAASPDVAAAAMPPTLRCRRAATLFASATITRC